jgi:hypothetical protein
MKGAKGGKSYRVASDSCLVGVGSFSTMSTTFNVPFKKTKISELSDTEIIKRGDTFWSYPRLLQQC